MVLNTLGLLLDDHLVTMGVCINPWGAMYTNSVLLLGRIGPQKGCLGGKRLAYSDHCASI